MTVATPKPKLLLPFLAPFYDQVIPLSWLIVRAVIGLDLAIHGWEKVARLPAIVASVSQHGVLAAQNPQLGVVHNVVLAFFEFIGGICIALGLFTRFFAAAAAIELAIITFGFFWPKGFHASEYTLWWGLIAFAIALRGGGPYSIDRRLSREL
jgi:putative oxidoreductase